MTPEPQEIDNEPPATAAERLEAVEVEWDCADSNAYQDRVEAGLEPEADPYPTFDDDPARWGLRPEPPMTDAELEAAAEAEAWGPEGPYASYAEWAAEIRPAEPEAGL